MGNSPSLTPSLELAQKTLPSPLFKSLKHICAQGVKGCVLAGGTALAGFYAAHRRSDDLDFFTASDSQQRALALAIKSLGKIDTDLQILNESAQYFEALGRLEKHEFKITAVADPNLFRVGHVVELPGNLQVVDLETLFKMKAATLVSRCSEKDLYDLIWLFGHFPDLSLGDLIRLGNEIDAGVDGEAMLTSISGTILHESACGFSLSKSKRGKAVFEEIQEFRDSLIRELVKSLENEPVPPLGELVRKLKRLR